MEYRQLKLSLEHVNLISDHKDKMDQTIVLIPTDFRMIQFRGS